MSLTTQLGSKQSPVSKWIEAHTDRKSILRLTKQINDVLAQSTPLILEGIDTGFARIVGTAFDYGFRWLIAPLVANELVAMDGTNMGPYGDWVVVMPSVVSEIVKEGNEARNNLDIIARNSVVLAWFEQNARSMYTAPELVSAEVREYDDPKQIAGNLYKQVPSIVVQDIVQLLKTVPTVWGNDLQASYIPNPNFEGSRDVGGADADWIINDVLYECKTTKNPRPFARKILLQSLGYVLLDYSGRYAIENLGWYFVRHQKRIIYPLNQILKAICRTKDLANLRSSFRAAIQKK